MTMKEDCIDYRNNDLGAARDIRNRLRNARSGQTINFICSEDQVVKLLREITFQDGMIVSRASNEEGVFITVRKV